MSRKYSKAHLILSAAVCVTALGNSPPLWADSFAAQVGNLQSAREVGSALPSSPAPISDLRLAMMDGMMEMGGMGGGTMGGGMPPDDSMSSPDAPGSMQDPMPAPPGMDMMGKMRGPMQKQKGMTRMAPNGHLPGFPGASHLYHIGATGFFLDHPQHITLSSAQKTSLNRIKEKTLLDRASADRRIEDAEQELWTLTAADSPDGAKIEAKVKALEKLRSEQRLAFIRAVGEAGKVLTADQQAALLGTQPAAGKQPAGSAPPAATSKPAPAPAMPGMPGMPGMPPE